MKQVKNYKAHSMFSSVHCTFVGAFILKTEPPTSPAWLKMNVTCLYLKIQ